jgi:hypothetical protein
MDIAHKYRIRILLAFHDMEEMLSKKQLDDICTVDKALMEAIRKVKEG